MSWDRVLGKFARRVLPHGSRSIHIVNPFACAVGGSELRAVSLFSALRDHAPVRLWSTSAPNADLVAAYPIEQIDTRHMRLPYSGTLVIVGVYWRPGGWLRFANPRRAILVYNTPNPDWLAERHGQLQSRFGIAPEVRYASNSLRASVQGEGEVEISLFDLERFRPAHAMAARPFTIGRLSRDEDYKHHPEDARIYRALAGEGYRVRIMGPSRSLVGDLSGVYGIDLVPAGAIEASAFLRSLDCFFYRTDPCWVEPHGRVVFEAMACALPVVCDRAGGYADLIAHAQTGYLFGSSEEALHIVRTLAHSPERAHAVGEAARAFVVEHFGAPKRSALVASYIDTVPGDPLAKNSRTNRHDRARAATTAQPRRTG